MSFDYAVTFLGEDGAELTIEGRFLVWPTGESSPREVVPGWQLDTYSVVIPALHTVVESVEIGTSDSISVSFSNGLRLVCNPDPMYEAWSLWTRDDGLYVCGPSGEV